MLLPQVPLKLYFNLDRLAHCPRISSDRYLYLNVRRSCFVTSPTWCDAGASICLPDWYEKQPCAQNRPERVLTHPEVLRSAVEFVRTECSGGYPVALTLPRDGAWYRGLRVPTPGYTADFKGETLSPELLTLASRLRNQAAPPCGAGSDAGRGKPVRACSLAVGANGEVGARAVERAAGCLRVNGCTDEVAVGVVPSPPTYTTPRPRSSVLLAPRSWWRRFLHSMTFLRSRSFSIGTSVASRPARGTASGTQEPPRRHASTSAALVVGIGFGRFTHRGRIR